MGMLTAYGPLLLIALTLAVWAVVLSLDFFRRETWRPGTTLWSVFLALAVTAVTRGTALGGAEASAQLSSSTVWVLHTVNLTLAAVAGVALAVAGKTNPVMAPRSGRTLWLSLLAVYGAAALAAVFGVEPSVKLVELATPPALLSAIYLLPRVNIERTASMLWVAATIVVAASLTAWVIGWEHALVDVAERRVPLPGVSQRLQGVMEHPNGLAPIAGLALVITVWKRRRWLVVGVPSVVVLLATDSLTAIAAASVALLCLWVYVPDRRRGTRGWVLLSAFFAAAVGVAIVPSVTRAAGAMVEPFATLSGRTAAWQHAVARWQESPLVGYGPNVFGESFRAETGLTWFGQAHNQFLQSLAETGLLGGAALLVFVVLAARIALRTADATAGLSVAIAAMFALRMMTEAPLRGAAPATLLLVAGLLGVLLAGLEERWLSSVEAAGPTVLPQDPPLERRHLVPWR